MKFLFFGAGASYGSDDRNKWILPPLGTDLFGELVKQNPTLWNNAKATFQKNKDTSFEDAWYAFRTEVLQNDLVPLIPYLQDLARYFFKFKPSKDNLYVKLCEKIKASWNEPLAVIKNPPLGVIATLNYDILLHRAMRYNKLTHINPITPHGCCNILCNWRDLIEIDLSRSKLKMTSSLLQKAPTQDTYNETVFNACLEHHDIPLMAYYEKDKQSEINNEFLDHHKALFTDNIQAASKIVIVGVAFIEHDHHIWQPISKSKAEILYINPGKEDNERFKTWALKNELACTIISKKFDAAFDEICRALDLNTY